MLPREGAILQMIMQRSHLNNTEYGPYLSRIQFEIQSEILKSLIMHEKHSLLRDKLFPFHWDLQISISNISCILPRETLKANCFLFVYFKDSLKQNAKCSNPTYM